MSLFFWAINVVCLLQKKKNQRQKEEVMHRRREREKGRKGGREGKTTQARTERAQIVCGA